MDIAAPVESEVGCAQGAAWRLVDEHDQPGQSPCVLGKQSVRRARTTSLDDLIGAQE
jgi:hypothetical protein